MGCSLRWLNHLRSNSQWLTQASCVTCHGASGVYCLHFPETAFPYTDAESWIRWAIGHACQLFRKNHLVVIWLAMKVHACVINWCNLPAFLDLLAKAFLGDVVLQDKSIWLQLLLDIKLKIASEHECQTKAIVHCGIRNSCWMLTKGFVR